MCILRKSVKKINNLDEEKFECTVGNKEICFWHGKKAENAVSLFLTLSGLFLSLTIGTAKLKQLPGIS